MGAFEYGLLVHKVLNVRQFKFLFPVIALPLVLLQLLTLDSKALVLTLWGALGGLFEGSGSAFLLLNGVIATIIASSRRMENENVVKGGCGILEGEENKENLSNDGDDYNKARGLKYFLEGDEGQVSIRDANQEDQVIVVDGNGGGDHNVEGRHENDDGDGDDVEGRHDDHGNHVEGMSISGGKKVLHREGGHDKLQAPSIEEVWAAIASGATMNAEMLKKSDKHNIVNKIAVNEAAVISATVENAAVPSAAATLSSTACETADIEEKPPLVHAADGDVDEAAATSDTDAAAAEELEELNRRAEEFIARFNHNMRLQRLESLQRRQARQRRHSASRCHHNYVPPHLPRPPAVAGLLVG